MVPGHVTAAPVFFLVFFLFITRVQVNMARPWAEPLRPRARPKKKDIRYMHPPSLVGTTTLTLALERGSPVGKII